MIRNKNYYSRVFEMLIKVYTSMFEVKSSHVFDTKLLPEAGETYHQ